jgi:hypothetical protein
MPQAHHSTLSRVSLGHPCGTFYSPYDILNPGLITFLFSAQIPIRPTRTHGALCHTSLARARKPPPPDELHAPAPPCRGGRLTRVPSHIDVGDRYLVTSFEGACGD